MNLDPKTAVDAAKDIATHAVEKAADIVETPVPILKGDITGGVGAIVEDATAIATHMPSTRPRKCSRATKKMPAKKTPPSSSADRFRRQSGLPLIAADRETYTTSYLY